MQMNMHNMFLYVDTPNILGSFLLFVGQHQLEDNYLPYPHLGDPEYFR